MEKVTIEDVKKIAIPRVGSHKGQNGRLLIIGGSELFHAASLWALTVASRIVDLVHYSSTPENNELVLRAKEEFRSGIVVPRKDVDAYIEEDDCILIGLGMTRDRETTEITNSLLDKYPQKQWVLDAGALQMMDVSLIPKGAILTPHHGEFALLWNKELGIKNYEGEQTDEAKVKYFAQQHNCIVLLKGDVDVACNGEGECRLIEGGNPGMTKGGTGDVLSGLIASLTCTNDPWVSTLAGSYINKKAGDTLYEKVGPYFNATDLANEIPVVMKATLLPSGRQLF